MKFWLEKGGWTSERALSRVGQKRPDEIQSIAVIRHAALGDQVLTRPFLREARRFFPNASLTLSLISSYRYGAPVDLVHRVHIAAGRERPRIPLLKQISKARELGYHDIVFDFAATTRSYWLCALTPAWLKIGFPYHHRLGRFLYDATILRSDLRFEAEVLLDALNLLGCKTEHPLQFDLPEAPTHRKHPYVVYFPGASASTKQWPWENFAQLLSLLAKAHPELEHVVLEGISPLDAIGEIVERLPGIPNVTPMTALDLPETSSLLKGASLVVSNDTGIRNLAIAANTPTVGIFFSTVPFRYWPRSGGHDVVFNADGNIPSVAQVAEAVERALLRQEIK
jgi:ADP-heptose:LPS heptosyltransferase